MRHNRTVRSKRASQDFRNMNSQEALQFDSESDNPLYVEYDAAFRAWLVLGTKSGFVYRKLGTKEDAERAMEKLLSTMSGKGKQAMRHPSTIKHQGKVYVLDRKATAQMQRTAISLDDAERLLPERLQNIELWSWLDSLASETVKLFLRILASLPGGDRLEDIGYEPFLMGWKEAQLLEEMLSVIENSHDVEAMVDFILYEEEEEEEE